MREGDKKEARKEGWFLEEQFNGANSFVEGTKQILGNMGLEDGILGGSYKL